MILLAIETTRSAASFAVLQNNKVVYQDYLDVKKTHSETIISRIDNALISLKLDKQELSGVCISNGPGSFTGIRIGLATAKGICTGLKIPLLGFNTLEILASNVYGTNKKILSVLDARMNEAYVAIFDKDLNVVEESHCRAYSDITKSLNNEEYICVGDLHLLSEEKNIVKALLHQNILCASSMFSLIKHKNIEIKYDEEYIFTLEPFYIRSAESQVNKKQEKK